MRYLEDLLKDLNIDENSEEWKMAKTKIKLSVVIKELIRYNPKIQGDYKNLLNADLEDEDIHELVDILFDIIMRI